MTTDERTILAKNLIKLTQVEAKSKLEKQLNNGIFLGERGINLIKTGQGQVRTVVDEYRLRLEQWVDLTIEVLNEVFHSSSYSSNFKSQKSSVRTYVGSSWQPDIEFYLRMKLKPRTDFLTMLIETLPEFSVQTLQKEEKSAKIADSQLKLKEKIENHPVIVFSSALVIGFVAGFASHIGIQNAAGLEVLTQQQFQVLQSNARTNVSQPDSVDIHKERQILEITIAHNERLKALHQQLLVEEQNASDYSNNAESRASHRESAESIKQSIESEHESYNENLKNLKSQSSIE